VSRVYFTGAVPSLMAENSDRGDWAATLALVGDLTTLRSVELVGPGALYFSAQYDPFFGVVFLSPGAAADYEGLTYNGGDPALAYTLRYTYADGTTDVDPATLRVTVTDRDDTAPQGLRFLAGGTIRADQLGGVIGTLAVDDPDTAGPFSFQIIGWDDWMFEFDGPLLRLRDGFNLGYDAIPTKTLIVDVSDGRQSAAFVLDIGVTDTAGPAPPTALGATPVDGIAALGDGRVVTLRSASEFTAATATGDGGRTLVAVDTPDLFLPGATRLQFAEGWLEFVADGPAHRASLLYQAIEHAAPSARALAALVHEREQGNAWLSIAGELLANNPATTASVFLDGLFLAALGRFPDAAERAVGLATLAAGGSRAQLAVDVTFSAEAVANAPAHPDGIWVAQPFGLDALPVWMADRGGIGPAEVEPAPDIMFA